MYGDLVVWKQILDHAKTERKPVIFVTDDRKKDWWNEFEGKKIGPSRELRREFYEQTGLKFYMYNSDHFMTFSKEYLTSSIKETAIKEVESIRIEDESEQVKSLERIIIDSNTKMTHADFEEQKKYLNGQYNEYLSNARRESIVSHSMTLRTQRDYSYVELVHIQKQIQELNMRMENEECSSLKRKALEINKDQLTMEIEHLNNKIAQLEYELYKSGIELKEIDN